MTRRSEMTLNLYMIETGDRPVCTLACELLQKAVDRAKNALIPIRGESPQVTKLDAEGQMLIDTFAAKAFIGIAPALCPALRVALSVLYDANVALQKKEIELLIENDDTDTRIKQINRLLSDLDVAGLGQETSEA